MSKQGIMLSVPDNQEGKNPVLVIDARPLPVKLEADLLSSDVVGERAIKISSSPSKYAATLNGLMYTISGSYSIAAGNYLAMNITFAAESVIHGIDTNSGLPIYVYSSHATGTADGVLSSVNRNLCSVDATPATAQLFYAATPVGNISAMGIGSIEPFLVADEDCLPSVLVKNTSGGVLTIDISISFEEISARNPALGLTPSSFIEATTEMSTYG